MMIRAFTLAAGIAVAGTAQAGFVGYDMRVDAGLTAEAQSAVPGATVYRMYAVFDNAGNVVLNVFDANFATTDGSTLFNSGAPFGGNTAPNSGFFGFDPTLRFDTFVTIGEESNLGSTSVALDPDFAFSSNGVAAGGWANTNPNNLLGLSTQNGDVWETLVGQFTVVGGSTRDIPGPSGNGDGAWNGLAGITFNSGLGTQTTQLFDQGFIPTPGALALFGLAGLTASRRRRSA